MERGGIHDSGSGSGSRSDNLKIQPTLEGECAECRTPISVRPPDQYVPVANLIRIMRKVLPTHAKISDEAKEGMQDCVSEYITLITREANKLCNLEKRKTITADDVLWAMNKLGFHNYVDPLNVYINRYREYNNNLLKPDPFVNRTVGMAPLASKEAYGPGFNNEQQKAIFGGATIGGYLMDEPNINNGTQAPMPNFDPNYLPPYM